MCQAWKPDDRPKEKSSSSSSSADDYDGGQSSQRSSVSYGIVRKNAAAASLWWGVGSIFIILLSIGSGVSEIIKSPFSSSSSYTATNTKCPASYTREDNNELPCGSTMD